MKIFTNNITLLFMLAEAATTHNDVTEGIIISGGYRTFNSTIEICLPDQTCSIADLRLYYGRAGHISAPFGDRRVLVAGGLTIYGERTTSSEIIDFNSRQVYEAHDMLEPRDEAAATVLHCLVYVCGGASHGIPFDGSVIGEALHTCETFDGKTWQQGVKMHRRRMDFAMAELNGKIYAFGGRSSQYGEFLSSVEVFSTESMGWHLLPHMKTKRAGLGAAAYNGTVVACGGWNNDSSTWLGLSSCEMFNPVTQQWAHFPSMILKRKWLVLVAYHEELFAIGGSSQGTIESYNPAQKKWQFRKIRIGPETGFRAAALDQKCSLLR